MTPLELGALRAQLVAAVALIDAVQPPDDAELALCPKCGEEMDRIGTCGGPTLYVCKCGHMEETKS